MTGALAGGLFATPALGVMPAVAVPNTTAVVHTQVKHSQDGQQTRHRRDSEDKDSQEKTQEDGAQKNAAQKDREEHRSEDHHGENQDGESGTQSSSEPSASATGEAGETTDPSPESSPSSSEPPAKTPSPSDHAPTQQPSSEPTGAPSKNSTDQPTSGATDAPTEEPTGEPAASPSEPHSGDHVETHMKTPRETSSPAVNDPESTDSQGAPVPPQDEDHSFRGGNNNNSPADANASGAAQLAMDSVLPVRHVSFTTSNQNVAPQGSNGPSKDASVSASSPASNSQRLGAARAEPRHVGPPHNADPVPSPSKPDTRVSAEGNDSKRLGIPWLHDDAQVAGFAAAGLGVLVLGGVAFLGFRKRP